MSKFTTSQLLTIAAALILIVLLILAPDEGDAPPRNKQKSNPTAEGKEKSLFSEKKQQLPERTLSIVEDLEKKLENAEDSAAKLTYLDSLASTWKRAGEPAITGYYLRKSAAHLKKPELWIRAGDNYFNAFRASKGTNSKILIDNAVRAYQQALALDSTNMKAKTSLGVSFVEGAGALGHPPMKGIGILLEVVEEDPDNIDALINLGYFSIRSGQYAKAKERFNKVLEIRPDFAEAYLYLADIDLSQKDTSAAIVNLEQYKTLAKDSVMIERTDQYIQRLKKN